MKYMITSKEKPNNHPINFVHTDLESFILFNDSVLKDVDSQLVDVEDVPKIHNCIKEFIAKEKVNLPSSLEQQSDEAVKNSEQT